MLMERVAEIIRGWPYDGSLDRSEPIKAGETLVNGDWVTKSTDNTVEKVGASPVALTGLVVVGNGDSGSAANAGQAVVLWDNFIAKVSNYEAGSYTPGQALTVKNGVLTAAATDGSEPINAYVLDVVAAVSGPNPQTAHLVVLKV